MVDIASKHLRHKSGRNTVKDWAIQHPTVSKKGGKKRKGRVPSPKVSKKQKVFLQTTCLPKIMIARGFGHTIVCCLTQTLFLCAAWHLTQMLLWCSFSMSYKTILFSNATVCLRHQARFKRPPAIQPCICISVSPHPAVHPDVFTTDTWYTIYDIACRNLPDCNPTYQNMMKHHQVEVQISSCSRPPGAKDS
jgi:hypothetical protein